MYRYPSHICMYVSLDFSPDIHIHTSIWNKNEQNRKKVHAAWCQLGTCFKQLTFPMFVGMPHLFSFYFFSCQFLCYLYRPHSLFRNLSASSSPRLFVDCWFNHVLRLRCALIENLYFASIADKRKTNENIYIFMQFYYRRRNRKICLPFLDELAFFITFAWATISLIETFQSNKKKQYGFFPVKREKIARIASTSSTVECCSTSFSWVKKYYLVFTMQKEQQGI